MSNAELMPHASGAQLTLNATVPAAAFGLAPYRPLTFALRAPLLDLLRASSKSFGTVMLGIGISHNFLRVFKESRALFPLSFLCKHSLKICPYSRDENCPYSRYSRESFPQLLKCLVFNVLKVYSVFKALISIGATEDIAFCQGFFYACFGLASRHQSLTCEMAYRQFGPELAFSWAIARAPNGLK